MFVFVWCGACVQWFGVVLVYGLRDSLSVPFSTWPLALASLLPGAGPGGAGMTLSAGGVQMSAWHLRMHSPCLVLLFTPGLPRRGMGKNLDPIFALRSMLARSGSAVSACKQRRPMICTMSEPRLSHMMNVWVRGW